MLWLWKEGLPALGKFSMNLVRPNNNRTLWVKRGSYQASFSHLAIYKGQVCLRLWPPAPAPAPQALPLLVALSPLLPTSLLSRLFSLFLARPLWLPSALLSWLSASLLALLLALSRTLLKALSAVNNTAYRQWVCKLAPVQQAKYYLIARIQWARLDSGEHPDWISIFPTHCVQK